MMKKYVDTFVPENDFRAVHKDVIKYLGFWPPTSLIAVIVKSIFGKPPPLIDDVLYEPPLTITVNSLLEEARLE